MTKEHLKMAEDDCCQTVGDVALWYKGYLQGCMDTLKDEIEEMKKGDDNEKDIEN